MNVLSLQWDRDSHLGTCKDGDSHWWPHHNIMVYEDWYLHSEQNYADRLKESALFVNLAFSAEKPEKQVQAVIRSDMPGWNLVERQSCADDGEPVLLAQDQVSFDCVLVLPGNKAKRSQHYGTGYCGMENVHSGYRDYLIPGESAHSSDVSDFSPWGELRSQRRKVMCAGHSRGGSVCELYAACVNNGKQQDQDFRRLMWAKGEPSAIPPLPTAK
eukprot:g28509.t1